MLPRTLAFSFWILLITACSASGGSRSLVVGKDGTGGGGSWGRPGEGGGTSLLGDASAAPRALSVQIEQHHAAVRFVTLRCAGDCADVVAVATGGNGPYTYLWEDGSTDPARHVCPTATTDYRVTAEDTPI